MVLNRLFSLSKGSNRTVMDRAVEELNRELGVRKAESHETQGLSKLEG